MVDFRICFLCGGPLPHETKQSAPDLFSTDCQTCGPYLLDSATAFELDDRRKKGDTRQLARLSAFTRRQNVITRKRNDWNTPPPCILSRPATDPDLLGSYTLDDIFAAWPTSVADRLDRSLINLADMSAPGQSFTLKPIDYPVFCAEDANVMGFMLWQLEELKYIVRSPRPADHIPNPSEIARMAAIPVTEVVLTASGWNHVAEIERAQSVLEPLQGFVAMWFSAEVEAAFREGIQPAIEAAGYRTLRIDMKEHVRRIDDEIVAEIRKSRFIVADFTKHRGGVYFEAGLAMGLGLSVFWTCRKGDMPGLHFDIRQYNTIDWQEPLDLRTRLLARIEAVVGRPRT